MKNFLRLLPVLFLSLMVSCRSAEEKRAAKEAKRAEQEAEAKRRMHENVPPDSPLMKVELGMSESQVTEILGPQSSTDTHVTGKAYNPFNYGGRDTMRIVYYWKGIGRVEFSAGSWGQRNGAILCIHDPNEPGQRR
ncbi:MAG: hypothetical protein JNK78_12265 [Planctomycetes bacterium]|nr:hypothetical protein [Planctomycetota bacterium]